MGYPASTEIFRTAKLCEPFEPLYFVGIGADFALRSPDVEFCGYTIPHPSEAKMNLRIQTYGESELLS